MEAGPGPSSEFLLERDSAREKIRKLREKLVFRCKNLDNFQPFIAEPTVPPADPEEAEAEQQVRRHRDTVLHAIFLRELIKKAPLVNFGVVLRADHQRTSSTGLTAKAL